MTTTMQEPIAVVGVSAIMPNAPDAATFWANIKDGRYSISDVPPERWDPELYYDPDPHTPDKTYSRIGGWVRDLRGSRWRGSCRSRRRSARR
jgi:acyl transferase domain-containing protein